MNLQYNKNKILSNIMIILFSLTFFNFLNRGSLIFLIGFILYFLFALKKIQIKKETFKEILFIFLFTGSYTFIINLYKDDGPVLNVSYIFAPIIGFLLTYLYLKNFFKYEIKEKKAILLINVMIYSFFIHGSLNIIYHFKIYGNFSTRNLTDIWTQSSKSGTGQNALFILTTVFMPILLYKLMKKNLRLKEIIFYGCPILASLYASFTMGNRTYIMILILVTFLTFFIGKIYIKNIKILKIILVIFFILVISLLLYNLNIFGIKEWLESSFIYQRLTSKEKYYRQKDPRFNLWKKAFDGMFENPFGGYKTNLSVQGYKEGGYAHNLWLDVGYSTGIIPFIFLVLYTIKSWLNLHIFLKSKYSDEIKITFLALMTCLMLSFFVEPIIEGMFLNFLVFFILNGLIFTLNLKGR